MHQTVNPPQQKLSKEPLVASKNQVFDRLPQSKNTA